MILHQFGQICESEKYCIKLQLCKNCRSFFIVIVFFTIMLVFHTIVYFYFFWHLKFTESYYIYVYVIVSKMWILCPIIQFSYWSLLLRVSFKITAQNFIDHWKNAMKNESLMMWDFTKRSDMLVKVMKDLLKIKYAYMETFGLTVISSLFCSITPTVHFLYRLLIPNNYIFLEWSIFISGLIFNVSCVTLAFYICENSTKNVR